MSCAEGLDVEQFEAVISVSIRHSQVKTQMMPVIFQLCRGSERGGFG